MRYNLVNKINAIEVKNMFERKNTKQINIGKVTIGGGAPISVQSMTNTKTTDTKATVNQIEKLNVSCREIQAFQHFRQ